MENSDLRLIPLLARGQAPFSMKISRRQKPQHLYLAAAIGYHVPVLEIKE
jgi:hypothetical protein